MLWHEYCSGKWCHASVIPYGVSLDVPGYLGLVRKGVWNHRKPVNGSTGWNQRRCTAWVFEGEKLENRRVAPAVFYISGKKVGK